MSDATQHTPGPWAVSMPGGQTTFNGRRVTVTHNGSMIADLDWNSPAENLANAALIALAPTLLAQRDALLAALQAVVDRACALEEAKSTANDDALTCLEGRLETAIVKARAAIALAGGGSK